jgi:hypothetical protein
LKSPFEVLLPGTMLGALAFRGLPELAHPRPQLYRLTDVQDAFRVHPVRPRDWDSSTVCIEGSDAVDARPISDVQVMA